MTTNLDALRIRRLLGRSLYGPPTRFGLDGWRLLATDSLGAVIVTCADVDDVEWVHASMSWADRLPTWDELSRLRDAVYGDGWAYQVFAPPSDHVNIHEYCLHLWGRLDGEPVLPDFTYRTGSI